MPTWSDDFSGYSNYRLDWVFSAYAPDVENNRTRVIRKLSITRTGGSGTTRLNEDSTWSITGGGNRSGNFGYDFRNYTTLVLMSDEVWIDHNADGTASVVTGASISTVSGVPLGDAATGNHTVTLQTIPRATTPSYPSAFDAGAAVTISLPRASSSFTHDVTYKFGGASGTIATGAGVSASWTPALSLLTQIPASTSGSGEITVVTKKGSTVVGTVKKAFTLRAPASVVPSISAINAVDDNPDVASLIGAYVQGQSRLKATVVASGAYGSTIKASKVTVDGQIVDSGQSVGLPMSGTRVVAAAVTDSRGRTDSDAGSVTVLPYDLPSIADFSVARADSGSAPDTNGEYLLVTLDASVSSLIVGSEKNAMTVTVATRPRGGSVWTDRDVLTPGLTYDGTFLVSGGGIFSTTASWDVRVQVSDRLQMSQDFYAVPTAGAIVDATPTKQAFGKMVEESGPASQIQGPARTYGDHSIDGDTTTGGDFRHRGGYPVEPVGIVAAFAGGVAPPGWLLCNGQAVSRTTYADLFAVIGTTYGAGNGTSTFNVPNLKGRVPVGVDSAQSEFNTLGKTGGAKTHTLTTAQMPAHSHGVGGQLVAGTGTTRRSLTSFPADSDAATETVGGGQAHNNLQPYLTVNHIIKAL